MKTASYLAFDFGAESGRALVGTLDDGRLTVKQSNRFSNRVIKIDGHLHWDVAHLFDEIKKSLRICAEQEIVPESIGIDTWGVDFSLVGNDGELLFAPFCYRDHRTAGAMESFFAKMPREKIYELTGIQFLSLNTLFQLESMVMAASPFLSRAADLLFVPDIFTYMLTGRKVTEFTFATTSQLFNPMTMDWEERLFNVLGLKKSLMRPVVMPGTVVGPVSDAIVSETGYRGGPVVAVATHDTGSAVAAVPAVGENWAYISCGTWSLMGVESKSPILSKQALAENFTNEGGVGETFRVLKNIMGLWPLQQCKKVWSKDREIDYSQLVNLAEQAPPFVSMIDVDNPDFLNPPDMPVAIGDYCVRTGQKSPESKGAMVRCILESLALKYRFVLSRLRRIHKPPIEKIHIIGGGTHNNMLCRFTAEATGLPVFAGPTEGTAIGNLLVQAMAAGQIDSPEKIREVVRKSFLIKQYESVDHEKWEKPWQRFLELVDR